MDSPFSELLPRRRSGFDIPQARASMFDDIQRIRVFRNRIAHHEPIFARQLTEDRDRIGRLIHWRPLSAGWLGEVLSLLENLGGVHPR